MSKISCKGRTDPMKMNLPRRSPKIASSLISFWASGYASATGVISFFFILTWHNNYCCCSSFCCKMYFLLFLFVMQFLLKNRIKLQGRSCSIVRQMALWQNKKKKKPNNIFRFHTDVKLHRTVWTWKMSDCDEFH